MTNSILLTRAESMLAAAELLQAGNPNEETLGIEAFLASRALVFAIFHIFGVSGQKIPVQADVDYLIQTAQKKGIDLGLTPDIEENTEALTLWGIRAWSIVYYRIPEVKVDRMIKYIRKYIDVIKNRKLPGIGDIQSGRRPSNNMTLNIEDEISRIGAENKRKLLDRYEEKIDLRRETEFKTEAYEYEL